jgi:hypothetical protein
MNFGIRAPRIMVVMHTIMRVVLLMTDTWSAFSSVDSIVRMRANATEPLMVPANVTIESSLLLTFHFYFLISLNSIERPKIAVTREITQITSSKARKLREMTYVVR